jgi:2-oxoisovalerate dehydrogenase E1 component alpha subunit
VTDLSSRAVGYGMPGVSVDGMDLLEVYAAAKPAVDRARSGEGPSLIEARTYRYMPNTSNDDDTRYRERAEVEKWRGRDPIALLRQRLGQSIKDEELAAIEQGIATEVAEAAAWAEAEPDAAPLDALRHTWAEREALLPAWANG